MELLKINFLLLNSNTLKRGSNLSKADIAVIKESDNSYPEFTFTDNDGKMYNIKFRKDGIRHSYYDGNNWNELWYIK